MTEPRPELDELLERAFRYALSLTHDRHQSEELLQDACLAISRRDGPWRIDYLISVIRNRHIDLYRHNSRLKQRTLREIDRLHANGQLNGQHNGHGNGQVSEPSDDTLSSALAELNPDERELLFLAVVEGHTAAEIAKLTGRPRGTVLSSIHRTKRKLRLAMSLRDPQECGIE